MKGRGPFRQSFLLPSSNNLHRTRPQQRSRRKSQELYPTLIEQQLFSPSLPSNRINFVPSRLINISTSITMSGNSISVVGSGVGRPKYNGPDTVLVTFRCQFAILPPRPVKETFSLDNHPSLWKDLSKSETADSIHDCIRKIGEERNGASKLLLAIFWSHVSRLKNTAPSFWSEVRKEAWQQLSKFHGRPEQYVGLVENVVCKNKGLLGGLVSSEGQKYFKVDRNGNLTWLSDTLGLEMSKIVIGELPTLELTLI